MPRPQLRHCTDFPSLDPRAAAQLLGRRSTKLPGFYLLQRSVIITLDHFRNIKHNSRTMSTDPLPSLVRLSISLPAELFTELDVMGANEVTAVYSITASSVTAQTPVLTQVEILGSTHDDLANVFDPDILHKTK